MFENSNFPPASYFYGEWKVIYLEPILSSGERIAILIVVRVDRELLVFDTLHPTVIDNLYGVKSTSFQGLISLIKRDILKNNGESSNVIEGVSSGCWHEAQSTDIKGIVKQAIYRSASLGSAALEALFEPHSELLQTEHIDDKWSTKVRERFLEQEPSYRDSFAQRVQVSDNVKILCGFHTKKYTVKFNVCTVQTIGRMKANLMDLQILESHNVSKIFDMIVYLPLDNDILVPQKNINKMKEHVGLLQERIEDNQNIRIVTCHSADEGADRMLEILKAS